MSPNIPFSIPAIRNFVPEKIRPYIIIFFVLIVQFSSGGVYLAALSEIVASTALLQEDIMMIGFASLTGMALTFTIMFRLKFRFPSKTVLLVCCAVIIASNLICIYSTFLPLLVAVAFVAGIFRMWATFECMSTIQLWLTPKREFAIFFCFVYFVVQSSAQFSGIITAYISFFSKWEYMHWLMIGLLLLVALLTLILFRNYRSMQRLPLYGIDWMGGLLWALIIMCFIFVLLYGEHYDWFDAPQIRIASILGGIFLALNLWRASFIRHPFINLQTWKYKVVLEVFFLYFIMDLLLSPSKMLEHLYMESTLHYDSLNTISLNWALVLGLAAGSIFTYQTFALRKWRYKTITIIGFSCVVLSLLISYLTIDFNQSKSSMIIPLFLRSFGFILVAICFITALTRVPFIHFPQTLTLQTFANSCLGSALSIAFISRLFKTLLIKNSMFLGATVDNVNPDAEFTSLRKLQAAVQAQAIMVSMKEIYGWLTLVGIFFILIFLLHESNLRPSSIHPTYRNIRRWIKHESRMDKKGENSSVIKEV